MPPLVAEIDGKKLNISPARQFGLSARGRNHVPTCCEELLGCGAAKQAACAGQGFAIASRWMFAPELAKGEVVSCYQNGHFRLERHHPSGGKCTNDLPINQNRPTATLL